MRLSRRTRHSHVTKYRLLSLASAVVLLATPHAEAQNLGQCLKNTASCGIKIAQTQIDLLSAATDVLLFTAENPNCIADIAASNFVTIGVSASMVGLAATGVLKQQGGTYRDYIYGAGGRPMVEALESIVPVPAISNLLKDYADDAIGQAFAGIASSIPIPSAGAPNLHLQLGCGSAIAVAGKDMLGKVKTFVGHAKGAVKSCSAAASCFSGALVDIVKDPVGAVGSAGEFLADTADDVKDFVFGGCKNQDTQLYFNANFKPWQNELAYQVVWGGNPNAYSKAGELVNQCVKYYDGCDSDKDTAKRQCVVMSSGGVQSDGNGWIAGKGLEQLVRTRQMELRIPQMLATELKWAAAQPVGERDAAILAAQTNKLPLQLQAMVKNKLGGFSFKESRAEAIRSILGFPVGYDGNGDFGGKDAKVSMAEKSVGALMLAYVPTQGADNKANNTKVLDLYKKYIPSGTALLQQIDSSVGVSLGKAIVEVVSQNGDVLIDESVSIQLQKMLKRLADCKDAHKDAKKTCETNISDAVKFAYPAMTSLGKVNSYAGIGARGVQDPAYKAFLKFIQDADITVGKHVAHSGLIMLGEASAAPKGGVASFGMRSAPGMVSSAKSDSLVAATNPSVTGAKADKNLGPNVAVNAGIAVNANTPEKFDDRKYRAIRSKELADFWLPKCKTNNCRNDVPPILTRQLNEEVARIEANMSLWHDPAAQERLQNSVEASYAAQLNRETTPVAVVITPPAASGPGLPAIAKPNTPNAPNSVAISVAPFNEKQYRDNRSKEFLTQWLNRCKDNDCRRDVSAILARQLDEEVAQIKASVNAWHDKAFQERIQDIVEKRYEAQLKAEMASPVPAIVTPPVIPSVPVKAGTLTTPRITNTPANAR